MSSDIIQYGFYVALLIVGGASEYFHLAPNGTTVGLLGLITGHFFGNGATKTVLRTISGNVESIANRQIEASVADATPTRQPPA